jgi:aminomethyltransferase
LIGKEKANHGDCVHIGRAQVGIVTSACLSPTLGKNIALCRIDVGHSEIGTEVEIGKIDGHQKRIPAKIVGFPHLILKKLELDLNGKNYKRFIRILGRSNETFSYV